MPKSNQCEFVLLGCVASNLATKSHPFVVLVTERGSETAVLRGYVLHGWQNVREFFPDEVREDVLYFLDSLSDYSPGEEAERFFAHLQNLSVGPIRCISSMVCSCDDLDRSVAAILDAGEFPVSWPESFRPA